MIIFDIFFFVLLVALSVNVLSYTFFCYEEANQRGHSLAPLAGMAVRSIARSVWSEMLILVLHPLGMYPRLWRAPSSARGPLVILVHGLFHNPSAWLFFRPQLHRNGFATACFGYSSWGPDFETTVAELRAYVLELIAENPEREIHLVGHSMGGLLLRAAVAYLEPGHPIRSLTTLGTPFRGSKLAPFALHSIGRFLCYECPTVRQVAALPFPAAIQGLCLFSPADDMVLPHVALRCTLPGWIEEETAAISHVAMLMSRSVRERVTLALREAAVDLDTAEFRAAELG